MLRTEKLLNKYGLTTSEVEDLLQVDVLSSLMKAKEIDKLALHVSTLDDRVVQYLESEEVKSILEENRKEAFVEDEGFDDFDLDFDLDLDKEITSGFDIRVNQAELDAIEEDDSSPTIVNEPKPPAPKVVMANMISYDNVSASKFFSEYVKMEVPEADSEGALVFQVGNILVRGIYESDFSRLGSMDLSEANMSIEILSKDAESILEYANTNSDAGIKEVDKEVLSLSREEVSQVYNTQQYLKNGKEVNTSFNAIESTLIKENNKEKFDKSDLSFSVGKAVHPNMVARSNFYITPKTLYGLADCDEFLSASVGGYSYITNYCEGNDLKQLRIFEIGGIHLNVPFSNTRNETIANSKVQDDDLTFSGKVESIVGETYTKNETLYEVGFTQVLPNEIKYDKVDSLSEFAGYFVFSSPFNARTFYVPAVVYNYFKKFYGANEVKAGTSSNIGLYTIYFVKDDDVLGFIMIETKNTPTSSPARLLPTNPLQYAQKIVGENALAFTDKVDIEDENSIQFIGKVKSRPVVEEVSFEEKILLFEQALEFMTVGEDDDVIADLQKQVEMFLLEDDDMEQAQEEIQQSIAMISEPEDELEQMSLEDTEVILPTPLADDSIVEENIEEEESLNMSADDFDIDIDIDIDDDDYDISDYYEKGGQTDDVGNPTDPLVLERMEVFIANQIPTLDKETYFTHGMQRKEAKRRFYEKYEYGAYNPKFSFDFFAKGGKVEDGNSTAIPITGSLEGVDVKKVFEEGSAYHDFHEYTREEKDAIKKSEGSESDAYNAITLPKNFPWQTAEIISSVDPFEFITESTGWLVENGYDPKKYALWVHPKFGKNPKLLTNLITQNDESYFDVVFLVEISKDQKEYLERSNPFRSSYYAKGGEVSSFVNNLQKGDLLKIKFGSIARRDNEVSLKVRSRNKIRNGRIDKITFENVNQPDGVRFYAYERGNGVFSFAMGDLAISNIEIVSDYAKGGEVKFDNDYYGYSARVPYKGEHFLVEMGKNWNAPLKEVAVTQNMRLVDEVMAKNVYLKMLKNKPMTPPEYAKGGKTKESVKAEIDEGLKDLEEGLERASKKHKAQSKVVSQIRSGIKESFAKGGKLKDWENSMKKRKDIEYLRIERTQALPNGKTMIYYKYNPTDDIYATTQVGTDSIYAKGGEVKYIDLVHAYDDDGSMFGTGTIEKIEGDKTFVRFDSQKVKEFDSDKVRPVMKKGGKTPLDKEFKFEKNFVIYVPSTSNVGDRISETELNKRVSEVEKLVAEEFGGFTKTETDGGYKSQSGEIIEEDIVKVSVFSTDKAWEDNEKGLVRAVKGWAKEWGQEAIGFEYEGDLYYIDATGKMAKGGKTYAKGGEVGKYPFYVLLERFGIVGAFNSEKDAKAYIKHEVELIYEGMPNERKKERAEARREYRIISREEAKKYTGYIVRNIDEEVGSSYKDYAKGGSTYAEGGEIDTASEIAKKMVSSMTDDDVANKVIESIYGSLESLESDIKEEDALIMAKKDMKSTRRFYEDILKDSILS